MLFTVIPRCGLLLYSRSSILCVFVAAARTNRSNVLGITPTIAPTKSIEKGKNRALGDDRDIALSPPECMRRADRDSFTSR